MEKKFRRKALAGLVILLLAFGGYCAYLTQVQTESASILSAFVDEEESALDYLNDSVLLDYFYSSDFLENFTVSNMTEYGMLEMIPKDNPDIVITLRRSNYDNDLFLIATGYANVGALSTEKRFVTLKQDIHDVLERVLEYIGHGELAERITYDDDDFATLTLEMRVIAFIGLLTLIIVFVFMMIYKRGWLLENYRIIGDTVNMFFGLGLIFVTTSILLLGIFGMIVDPEVDFRIGCLALVPVLFILGVYLVGKDIRKMEAQ
jgi:hypothetical protein